MKNEMTFGTFAGLGIMALGMGWGIGGMCFLMNLNVTVYDPPKTAPMVTSGPQLMYLTDPPQYSQDPMPTMTPTPPTK